MSDEKPKICAGQSSALGQKWQAPCAYYRANPHGPASDTCTHPSSRNPTDPVRGNEGTMKTCRMMRCPGEPCGPAGALYEEGVPF